MATDLGDSESVSASDESDRCLYIRVLVVVLFIVSEGTQVCGRLSRIGELAHRADDLSSVRVSFFSLIDQ